MFKTRKILFCCMVLVLLNTQPRPVTAQRQQGSYSDFPGMIQSSSDRHNSNTGQQRSDPSYIPEGTSRYSAVKSNTGTINIPASSSFSAFDGNQRPTKSPGALDRYNVVDTKHFSSPKDTGQGVPFSALAASELAQNTKKPLSTGPDSWTPMGHLGTGQPFYPAPPPGSKPQLPYDTSQSKLTIGEQILQKQRQQQQQQQQQYDIFGFPINNSPEIVRNPEVLEIPLRTKQTHSLTDRQRRQAIIYDGTETFHDHRSHFHPPKPPSDVDTPLRNRRPPPPPTVEEEMFHNQFETKHQRTNMPSRYSVQKTSPYPNQEYNNHQLAHKTNQLLQRHSGQNQVKQVQNVAYPDAQPTGHVSQHPHKGPHSPRYPELKPAHGGTKPIYHEPVHPVSHPVYQSPEPAYQGNQVVHHAPTPTVQNPAETAHSDPPARYPATIVQRQTPNISGTNTFATLPVADPVRQHSVNHHEHSQADSFSTLQPGIPKQKTLEPVKPITQPHSVVQNLQTNSPVTKLQKMIEQTISQKASKITTGKSKPTTQMSQEVSKSSPVDKTHTTVAGKVVGNRHYPVQEVQEGHYEVTTAETALDLNALIGEQTVAQSNSHAHAHAPHEHAGEHVHSAVEHEHTGNPNTNVETPAKSAQSVPPSPTKQPSTPQMGNTPKPKPSTGNQGDFMSMFDAWFKAKFEASTVQPVSVTQQPSKHETKRPSDPPSAIPKADNTQASKQGTKPIDKKALFQEFMLMYKSQFPAGEPAPVAGSTKSAPGATKKVTSVKAKPVKTTSPPVATATQTTHPDAADLVTLAHPETFPQEAAPAQGEQPPHSHNHTGSVPSHNQTKPHAHPKGSAAPAKITKPKIVPVTTTPRPLIDPDLLSDINEARLSQGLPLVQAHQVDLQGNLLPFYKRQMRVGRLPARRHHPLHNPVLETLSNLFQPRPPYGNGEGNMMQGPTHENGPPIRPQKFNLFDIQPLGNGMQGHGLFNNGLSGPNAQNPNVLNNLELHHQAMHMEAGNSMTPNLHRQLHRLLRERQRNVQRNGLFMGLQNQSPTTQPIFDPDLMADIMDAAAAANPRLNG